MALLVSGRTLVHLAPEGKASIIAAIVEPLNDLMPVWGVTTPLRAAHFLAQACYESARFTRLEENLNYSAFRIGVVWPALKPRAGMLAANPIGLANAAYAGRYGNSDEASGDGYRFRGRGLFQHTFYDNYSELQSALELPLIADPDLLRDPVNAVKAALYYFKQRGCLECADRDDVAAVTRKINAACEGIVDRNFLKRKAQELLS